MAEHTCSHTQLRHHSSIYIPTQNSCYSVCQELSACRIKTVTTRRGWGYTAAWLGRDRPGDVERTRLLACAEMAVGCGEESPARDSHSVYYNPS